MFRVIDTKTGKTADAEAIVRESWASDLSFPCAKGFAIQEDGMLIITDIDYKYTYCPENRFVLEWDVAESETQGWKGRKMRMRWVDSAKHSRASQAESPSTDNTVQDIHTVTAATIFGVDVFTDEQRREAASVNFGFLYGLDTRKLALTDAGVRVLDTDTVLEKQPHHTTVGRITTARPGWTLIERSSLMSDTKITYQEFSTKYTAAFKNTFKYNPGEVGFDLHLGEMVDLADDYPEYMARFDREAAKPSEEPPEKSTTITQIKQIKTVWPCWTLTKEQ